MIVNDLKHILNVLEILISLILMLSNIRDVNQKIRERKNSFSFFLLMLSACYIIGRLSSFINLLFALLFR